MARSIGLILCVLMGATPALAQVEIINQSFEQPALGPNGFNNGPVTGWTPVGSAAFGVFHPTQASWGYTAPWCNQVLYTNSGLVEQVTPAVLTPSQTLTLQVDVVRRPVFFNQNYKVQLVAGDAILAEDAGTLTPPIGGFLTSTLIYTAQPGDANLGQPIKIRLGGPSQCNFDNVRLNGTTNECLQDCYADCDLNGSLNIDDFICFQTLFVIGDPFADCDASGTLNIDDFICFQTLFVLGC
jgi:hypothetical protein